MLSWIVAALSGLFATGGMTLIELVGRSRWGPAGLLDWQINQATAAWILKRPESSLVVPGLALHFLHGLVAGLLFVVVLPLLPADWPAVAVGLGYGVVLFALTLLLFRPITGRALESGTAGAAAVAVALLTHLVYGAVLAMLLVSFG